MKTPAVRPDAMPRSVALNHQMRAFSRERLLGAALEVFAEQGYGGASMRQIAERAGMSPGLIYTHVPGKEALLHAVFERCLEDVRASFSAAAATDDPSGALERFIRASFEILDGNREFWRLSYSVRMQPAVVQGLGPRLGAWTTEIESALTRLLRGAGVPDALNRARLLFATIDGIAQRHVMQPGVYPLADVVDALVRDLALNSRGRARG